MLTLVRVSAPVLCTSINSRSCSDKDKLIDDKYAVPQSESWFNACEILKNAFRWKSLGDLDESEDTAMEDPERYADYPCPSCLPY